MPCRHSPGCTRRVTRSWPWSPSPSSRERLRGPSPPAPSATSPTSTGRRSSIPKTSTDRPSQDRLRALAADLFVICDYGQILSAETLATARLGGINVHGSLLPKYRGAAPINWAIYHGETETGVSIIHMTPRVDAGPLVAQGRTPIGPEETAVELEGRLAEIGSWLARRTIDEIAAGQLEEIPQDLSQASKARRLKRTDGLIDWARPAAAIKNQVRAMEPWPKTYTFWHRPAGTAAPLDRRPGRRPGRAERPGAGHGHRGVGRSTGHRRRPRGRAAADSPARRQTDAPDRRVLARLPRPSGGDVWTNVTCSI